jgi:hypothetical protein
MAKNMLGPKLLKQLKEAVEQQSLEAGAVGQPAAESH